MVTKLVQTRCETKGITEISGGIRCPIEELENFGNILGI